MLHRHMAGRVPEQTSAVLQCFKHPPSQRSRSPHPRLQTQGPRVVSAGVWAQRHCPAGAAKKKGKRPSVGAGRLSSSRRHLTSAHVEQGQAHHTGRHHLGGGHGSWGVRGVGAGRQAASGENLSEGGGEMCVVPAGRLLLKGLLDATKRIPEIKVSNLDQAAAGAGQTDLAATLPACACCGAPTDSALCNLMRSLLLAERGKSPSC